MVGSGMFNFLNLRLQQIRGTKEPFGRISLITVGDLFQLKPVFDKWIFENSQQKADVNIFVETKLCLSDTDDTYGLSGFSLYRNDFNQSNVRTCYGTAVYIKNDLNCTEIPYRFNFNNVEITIMVLSQPIPNIHVVGIYRSKANVRISQLIDALTHLHNSVLTDPTIPTVLLGDFNINLMQETTEQKALKKHLITDRGYTQLINQYTTDYRTQIDHIYTNMPQLVHSSGTLESYYSDHKPIFISLKAV